MIGPNFPACSEVFVVSIVFAKKWRGRVGAVSVGRTCSEDEKRVCHSTDPGITLFRSLYCSSPSMVDMEEMSTVHG